MPILIVASLVARQPAQGHSASDAYLTLTAETPAVGGTVIHGQWDIALRDLDFVLKLDDDGDGRLTWGEVHRHEAAIERLAYQHLAVGRQGGGGCALVPRQRLIDAHADGAYMALFFDVMCKPAPGKLMLRYDLFFSIDPSHRAIVVVHDGGSVATAVLSPDNSRIDIAR